MLKSLSFASLALLLVLLVITLAHAQPPGYIPPVQPAQSTQPTQPTQSTQPDSSPGRLVVVLPPITSTDLTPLDTPSTAHQKTLQASARVDVVMMAWLHCREAGAACPAEKAAYDIASEAFHLAIARELDARMQSMMDALANIDKVTVRLQSYAACKQQNRWWNLWRFWKNCGEQK